MRYINHAVIDAQKLIAHVLPSVNFQVRWHFNLSDMVSVYFTDVLKLKVVGSILKGVKLSLLALNV